MHRGRLAAVVFGDLVGAVAEEVGLGDAGAGLVGAAAERIVGV